MLNWLRRPVSSGAVHRRLVFCSHGHVSGRVVLEGHADAPNGGRVSVGSSTPWTAVSKIWDRSRQRGGQRGQPMQLTMATVAEHVVVQEDIVMAAVTEPAGDEPVAAGDGAGDDEPAEPCTKRRKTHVPPEVKEWFCSLARVMPDWTMTQCFRFAKRALPSFFEHLHSDTTPQVVLAQDSRYRSWPPALPGTRSCPGPGRHRVPCLQQSVLWRRSLGSTDERSLGNTWRRLPLL